MLGTAVGMGLGLKGGGFPLLGRAAFAISAGNYGGSGTTFSEAYGRYTATLINTPTFAAGPPAYFSTVAASNHAVELPDADAFDFAANESFTVALMLRRSAATPAASGAIITKTAAYANAGWSIRDDGSGKYVFRLHDGTVLVEASSPVLAVNTVQVLIARRDVGADQIRVFLDDASGTAVTDTTTATLANAVAVRIARLGGAGGSGSTMDWFKGALLREAVADADIPALSAAVRIF